MTRQTTLTPYGRRWRIDAGDRAVVVDDLVGVRHLATLLANPHVEVLAADLTKAARITVRGTSRQRVLDPEAVRQYRARLQALRDELVRAESRHDYERTASLRSEREWLVDELRRSTGLSGRSRDFADEAERARVAVGKAIRRALLRVSEVDARLGEELIDTVQTGMYCCYRPLIWSRR